MGVPTDNWYLSGELHIESESSDRPDRDSWQEHFGHTNIWGKFTKIATVRMWGLQNCYGLLQNWDTDSLFIGLKDEGSNRKDAVIAFGDDQDDTLRFLFAGAGAPPPEPKELLRITSGGSVGIGTMSPSYLLDVNGAVRANRYYGLNSLSLNDYQTVNPASNVYLYSSINDRDSWIFLDSADTGSNWGIYHRQINSPIKQLPANSIGFVGGGNSDLKAYICLGDGSAYFKGDIAIGDKHALRGNDPWLRLNQDKAFIGVHTPGLFFPGSLNVGGGNDPGFGNASFAGNVVIGAGGNASLKIRHIDGKHYQNDQPDGLHLNWSNGQPVHVGGEGGDGKESNLYVHGNIFWKNDHSASNYIRLGDLLICWGSLTVHVFSNRTSQWETTNQINFPTNFLTTPIVTISLDDPGIGRNVVDTVVGSYQVLNTGFIALTKRIPLSFYDPQEGDITVNWIAMGR